MPTLNFSVDAALLRELGERLVGKQHIALAELVKNSYDADATEVSIHFDPKGDRIEVSDNGHGMDLEEFKGYWMRIGSPHKAREKTSRDFGRLLTGSKGVGRLAVQFLARKLKIVTVPLVRNKKGLEAKIDWEKAIREEELTNAEVQYELIERRSGDAHGTRIILEGLRHSWNSTSFEDLAREIWWLRPPFKQSTDAHKDKVFNIVFSSPDAHAAELFDKQLRAIMELWTARLIGRNNGGKVDMSLEFPGSRPISETYRLPNSALQGGEFEVRIFHLAHRQPQGIEVKKAREYFSEFGGVHVYDAGFHLPYYGTTESDWLKVESDHSHRLNVSKLLPDNLRVPRGMNFLPTLERMFGVVNVNTSKEKNLDIQITRDRLVTSKAYDDLVVMVRWAIDFYAMEEAKRAAKVRATKSDVEPVSEKAVQMEEVIEEYRDEIPKDTYDKLQKGINEVVASAEVQTKDYSGRIALLGPLATAGIATLAYTHELHKQLSVVDGIIKNISDIEVKDPTLNDTLKNLHARLSNWVNRARNTSALFDHLTFEDNRTKRVRLNAKQVLDEMGRQVEVLARGVPIDTSALNEELLLPKAAFSEWAAIFQNVLINAFNALLDAPKKKIRISSSTRGLWRELIVEDTGSGVSLHRSTELFEPFVRKSKISHDRQAMGYGGTGLGLTIVRLVADNLGCTADFTKATKGYNTAFRLRWREKK